MIVAGWNGAAAGPLIPYIQPYFKVSFTVTSLIYVGEAIGFVLGGISNTWLTDRYGLGKVIAFGALMQTLSYALIAPAIHMGVMVFGSVIAGYGLSLQDAAANAYIAGCPNMAFKMGLAHSFFGWGAFLSPLVGTAFVSHGVQWSLFYLTALGLSGLNVVAVILAFKLKAAPVEDPQELEMASTPTAQQTFEAKSSWGKVKIILKNRTALTMALFLQLYVGAEISMGGWIVSFLVEERDSAPSVGYVASGFWGALAVGRLILFPIQRYVGEKRAIYLYVLLGAAFQITIWRIPSLIQNAIATALVGLVLAPFYPIGMSLSSKLLPRELHSSAIGLIGAYAVTGAAIWPFVIGSLAETYGVWALHPMMLALFGSMGVIWFFVPDVKRRVD
ncbi:MFS general substrate transporter [Atractiella rhizophila]|nr:MFS general substrate transporter [Atractiella rhizophila]